MGTNYTFPFSKSRVYSAISLIYIAQGILYFLSLTALPAFFGLYPHIFTITQQNIFIAIAKAAPIVKIGYGFIADRTLNRTNTHPFIATNLGFFAITLICTVVLYFSEENPLFFLFIFALLFLMIAFFDAIIDAISVRFSAHDNRIGLVALMNISYSVGGMIASVCYMILPKGDPAAWFSFVKQTATLGIICITGLVPLLILAQRTHFPTEKMSTAQPIQPADHPPTNALELTEIRISKHVYIKIAGMMMVLLFLANIDALVEITTEKWMVQKFGEQGFSTITQFTLLFGLPIKIAVLVLLFVFRAKINGKEIPILYGCAFSLAGYWLALSFVDFQTVLALIVLSMIAGALLIVSISGLMMKFVPKKRAGAGYQLFTVWYNIPLMVLPVAGNSLYGIIGHEPLFLSIAVVILALIIPLLRRLDKTYARR